MPYGKLGIFVQVSVHTLGPCTKITKIKTNYIKNVLMLLHLKGLLEPQLAYTQNSQLVMVTTPLHDSLNLPTLQTFRPASSLFA
jgi:hypothetical protein